MSVKVLTGDCRTLLASLPDGSVRCCVTSPPYWGLRDYGVPGQLGLEATPAEYVAKMVEVFGEVRRVLADDGTLWLNLGDSYAGSNMTGGTASKENGRRADRMIATRNTGAVPDGLKAKDLVGVPWRVAFALQADGWYLRSDIIWHKPNPMPESVTDRPTKSHEYLFLLAKSERYYYNAAAIAEPVAPSTANDSRFADPEYEAPRLANGFPGSPSRGNGPLKRSGNKERKPASARGVPVDTNGSTNGAVAGSVPWEGATRNKRTVWTVPTSPFKGAHFATFPPALIEPCILAGSTRGDTVLDPFGGAGTTGLVADRLGRNAILCELNQDYAAMAEHRIKNDSPLFAEVSRPATGEPNDGR